MTMKTVTQNKKVGYFAGSLFILGFALVVLLASSKRASAAGGASCTCDVERKQLYLKCLHEYSVGSFGASDLTSDEASIMCASWAKVDKP